MNSYRAPGIQQRLVVPRLNNNMSPKLNRPVSTIGMLFSACCCLKQSEEDNSPPPKANLNTPDLGGTGVREIFSQLKSSSILDNSYNYDIRYLLSDISSIIDTLLDLCRACLGNNFDLLQNILRTLEEINKALTTINASIVFGSRFGQENLLSECIDSKVAQIESIIKEVKDFKLDNKVNNSKSNIDKIEKDYNETFEKIIRYVNRMQEVYFYNCSANQLSIIILA